MDFIEKMVSKKIKEAEPTLDVSGADRRVLQVAIEDFTNYLKFNLNLNDKEISSLNQPSRIERLLKKNEVEVDAFLSVWTGLWLQKWKQRVNLLLGKQDQNKMSTVTKSASQSLLAKLECREEIVGIAESALIKNAEICGTKIIAEYLIEMEMRKIGQDVNDPKQVLAILNSVFRKAREMAQRTGPVISILIDKNYYCQVSN